MAMALQNNVLVTFTNWFLNGFYMVSICFPFGFHLVSNWPPFGSTWFPISFYVVSIWSPFVFHSSSLLSQV